MVILFGSSQTSLLWSFFGHLSRQILCFSLCLTTNFFHSKVLIRCGPTPVQPSFTLFLFFRFPIFFPCFPHLSRGLSSSLSFLFFSDSSFGEPSENTPIIIFPTFTCLLIMRELVPQWLFEVIKISETKCIYILCSNLMLYIFWRIIYTLWIRHKYLWMIRAIRLEWLENKRYVNFIVVIYIISKERVINVTIISNTRSHYIVIQRNTKSKDVINIFKLT